MTSQGSNIDLLDWIMISKQLIQCHSAVGHSDLTGNDNLMLQFNLSKYNKYASHCRKHSKSVRPAKIIN